MAKKARKKTKGNSVKKTLQAIQKEEAKIEEMESTLIREEKKIESREDEIKHIEEKIKGDVETKPLSRITIKDINKGIIGALAGVVAHFGFIYGKEIAEKISPFRATLIYAFSFSLLLVLMYATGYRKIKDKRLLKFLPLRATVIYFISILVIVFIFVLFNQIDFMNIDKLYSEIAVTSVLAVLGAGTADLIGRH